MTPDLLTKIKKILCKSDYEPLTEKQLQDKLKIPSSLKKAFSETFKEMELRGEIARIKNNRWIIAQDAHLISGILHFNQKGFAFLVPEDGSEDIYIPAEDTETALHEDVALVRIHRDKQTHRLANQKNLQGRVIRILKRKYHKIVGTLEKTGVSYVVIPDNPRFIRNIYVPAPGSQSPEGHRSVKANVGDKVVAQLLPWKSRHLNPEGYLIERIGNPDSKGVDILSIIKAYQLPLKFPQQATQQAKRASSNPKAPAEFSPDRLDLRKEFIITIDPDTAKDFDDAISVKKLKNHCVEIGIHIADVSHYIKPNSPLDKEAFKRGNSTYLIDRVIPMLPEELSNGMCSLLPHVDRLTHSVFVTLDSKTKIIGTRICKTIIHSQHRLTYKEAFRRLQLKPKDKLDQFLHDAWDIASKLRKKRFDEGSLDLDFPEVKIHLDSKGRPESFEKIENDISHQLIEEFMLIANEVVAQTLKNRHTPTLYRIHNAPDEEKLQDFRETLLTRGIQAGDLTQRKELQKVLRQISQDPGRHALKLALLKSMQKATYQPKPEGHYGLAKVNYTHFTSPIRRYADLLVHRSLQRATQKLNPKNLAEAGIHLSQTEQNSTNAERDTIRLKTIEYFRTQVKNSDTFNAIITDIQNYGFFVELPDFLVSGLVHLSALTDDFYVFNEQSQTVHGRKNKKTFSIGDKIQVQVSRIDPFKKQIDFRVA